MCTRHIKEIYKDWQAGCLASDEELGALYDAARAASAYAHALGAGDAVVIYYVHLDASFVNALRARKRDDLVKH